MGEMQDINARLRAAVRSQATPPFLEAKIRARLREGDHSTSWFHRKALLRLIPITVAAGVCFAAGITYQLGHLRLTVGSQQSYIASVSNHVATLMRVGLGDHIHCSVFRKYPKNPPTAEQFVEKMGPQYAGLIPIVRSHIPLDYRLNLAHQCRYNGRKFVHLSLMNNSHLVSLSITKKGDGESFATEEMLPALTESGIAMYQAGVQRFQISAFETKDYLVYFVSDLPKEKNTEMMMTMAPQVKAFLNKQAI